MDPISKTHGIGRPRGMTRQQAEKQRTRIYALYLRGFSEAEIAESLQLNQSNVSRALSTIRKSNGRWFRENLNPHDRFENLFKTHYDAVWETIRESWILFHNTSSDRPETRANIIGRVQNGLALASKIVGISLPSLDDLHLASEQERIESEIRRLEKIVEEKRQLEKVNPFASP